MLMELRRLHLLEAVGAFEKAAREVIVMYLRQLEDVT